MLEQASGETLDIPEAKLRNLSLAGGVMAQVSRANPQVTSDERDVIVTRLQEHWNLLLNEAEIVTEVAVSEEATHLDRYRLAREFASNLAHEDAMKFVDVLFAIATADGQASSREIEEIRQISASLKLFHKEFIDSQNARAQELRAE